MSEDELDLSFSDQLAETIIAAAGNQPEDSPPSPLPSPKRLCKKSTKGGPSPTPLLQGFTLLRDFFQEQLAILALRMQEETNRGLREVGKRAEQLGARARGTGGKSGGRADGQGRGRKYIKSWMKLDAVRSIEQGQKSVREVSRQFKVKEQVVERWMASRDVLGGQVSRKVSLRNTNDSDSQS